MARPKGSTNKKVTKKKFVTKEEQKTSSKALGDVISDFTTLLGIKKCESCDRRHKILNRFIPFNSTKGKMTEEQYNDWKVFKESGLTTLNDAHMDLIEDTNWAIYGRITNPTCRNCDGTASAWLQLIKGVDEVYNEY
jgi:hypothetical protein